MGTGDVQPALHRQLELRNSVLANKNAGVHNQYLSLLAAFGLVGALVLAVFFTRAMVKTKRWPPVGAAWLLTILISFLTECTLGTLAGILFCTYFLAFRDNNV